MDLMIHPVQDATTLQAVEDILARAVSEHSDTFDRVEDVPDVLDHYGFHNETRSSVILSRMDGFLHYRLRILPVELHPVFSELRTLITNNL